MNDSTDDLDDARQLLKLDLPAAPSVLIVDDDELVLARLQELVVAAGYPVCTATNGIQALQQLEASAASIVITDLNMPGMDGLQLCRRIRQNVWPGYVYIVFLTGRDDEKHVLAGLDAGADDFLSKRTPAVQFTARLRTAKRVLALEYSLKSALEIKRQLAMTDPLTGIYNRRYLLRHLGRELKRAQRFGGDVSLLLLDVDHFKQINDTCGHVVGDQVLQNLTQVVTKCLQRATDWCARLGGDEFAIVLEGTSLEGARVCAEKVRQAIDNSSIDTSAGPIRITISVGVSALGGVADRDAATVQTLLELADTSLYASKSGGRNRVTSPNSQPQTQVAGAATHQWSRLVNEKMPVGSIR
ncbi:MAG: two-component system, cell cycle response regulator [Gammaproteobacteria bacterium]|jgi:diguanylate cyclase (GGDEF)-like protein|nr:two-component system, cell cycle response regulator [Gammaproteobacteria bacterium]